MTGQDILDVLSDTGAALANGHFVYKSWKHGSAYVNKDAIYAYPDKVSLLCHALSMRFLGDGVEVVIGPAIGGVILSQWTAHQLHAFSGKPVLSVYAEKAEDGSFVIKRGYDKLVTGRKVLVVEDILTTGASARKVVEAVRAVGGEVVGVGALCNRGGVTEKEVGDVPRLSTLVEIDLAMWEAEDCGLCMKNVPINLEYGHGAEYLACHPQPTP